MACVGGSAWLSCWRGNCSVN